MAQSEITVQGRHLLDRRKARAERSLMHRFHPYSGFINELKSPEIRGSSAGNMNLSKPARS